MGSPFSLSKLVNLTLTSVPSPSLIFVLPREVSRFSEQLALLSGSMFLKAN